MRNSNKLALVSKKSTKESSKKGSKAQAKAKADRKENKYNTLRMYMWR